MGVQGFGVVGGSIPYTALETAVLHAIGFILTRSDYSIPNLSIPEAIFNGIARGVLFRTILKSNILILTYCFPKFLKSSISIT